MRVKFLATGVIAHERDAQARQLIKDGLAVLVGLPKPGDFRIPDPKWSVGPCAGGHLAIQMDLLNNLAFYFGPPSAAHNRQDGSGSRYCSAFGRPIPDAILMVYEKLWNDDPKLRATSIIFPWSEPDENKQLTEELKQRKDKYLATITTLPDALTDAKLETLLDNYGSAGQRR